MTGRRPIRLLMTLDAVGGVWQYGLDLARALGERQVETILALFGPAPTPDQRLEAKRIPSATLIETGLPLDWLCDGPEAVLAAHPAIAALVEQFRADIVQFNMPTLAAAGPLPVPTIAVTHGCVSTWWEAAKPGIPLNPAYLWHRQLMAQGLRTADHVVAPSASFAQCVQQHYRLPHLPHIIHNGRAPMVATSAQTMCDAALTVGRLWDHVKRADLLDRVAARLPFPFHAAGSPRGPHGEAIALNHLHQLGHLDSVSLANQLARRPLFVSAASFEPFGLAVLEAAQAGCALILSDIPTFRELWDGAALFVPGSDEAHWADAIGTLMHDRERRHRLGEAARQRASRYTPSAMADGMLAIFKTALTAQARAAA